MNHPKFFKTLHVRIIKFLFYFFQLSGDASLAFEALTKVMCPQSTTQILIECRATRLQSNTSAPPPRKAAMSASVTPGCIRKG